MGFELIAEHAKAAGAKVDCGNKRPTILHIMSTGFSLSFLRGQASFLRASGYDVHVVASPGPELGAFGKREGVSTHAVELTRRVSPLLDLRTFWQLWRIVRQVRPDIVHAHFPKIGMLAMVAAFLARTPVRVFHLHGLRYETATGIMRALLFWMDKFACLLAHRVLGVSLSTRSMAIADRLCSAEKIKVLARGSINGVDTNRFTPADENARAAIRAKYDISANAVVIGFVGRIVRDKGIGELIEAWQTLREKSAQVVLLLVGPFERVRSSDTLPADVVEQLENDPRVRLSGLVQDSAALYAAMDIVVLPSYREGMPTIALEAAAMALPLVATLVSGCVDAVERGVTGTLVPPRDSRALAAALQMYIDDPVLRVTHGRAARARVKKQFSRETIWCATIAEYSILLAGRRASRRKLEA